MASAVAWPRSPPRRASSPRPRRRRPPAPRRPGSTPSSAARRVVGAAQLAVLHARGRAGVDGGLERAEVVGDRRLRERLAHDLAREVGLDLELARRAVEHDADVLVLAHLEPAPQIAQAPHAAQRDDVGRRDDHDAVGDLGADRARLGDLGAEVDDGQRVARLDRVEHGAGDARVDLLRRARPPRARAGRGSPRCACRASPAGGGRRSPPRPRRGRRRCAGAAGRGTRAGRP